VSWRTTGLKESEVAEGSLHAVAVDGNAVLLVRVAGGLRAVQGACPHIGGDLADGTVEQGRITCPLHAAVFDLLSGQVLADPFGVSPPEGAVEPLAGYPVRVVDGSVEVDLPAT
jgi:nitrite reductase/ring-hydroxylating ferredoxin subunit